MQNRHSNFSVVESKLVSLQKIHDEYSQLGSWPIDRKIIIKIWATLSFLLSQVTLFVNLVKPFTVF